MQCPKQTRRSLLFSTLATGAFLTAGKFAAAQEDQPGSDLRPQKGDLLVRAEPEHAGKIITPGDLQLGEPPLSGWPDSKTSVIRNGSRLNEILVVRLDPGEMDEQTRSRSADGIVAYSAICTHADVLSPAAEVREATKTFSNAFVTTPNSIPGKARKSCSGPRPGVCRHCRWR